MGIWKNYRQQLPETTFWNLGLGEFSNPSQCPETLLLPEGLKANGGIGMLEESVLGGGCCHSGSGPPANSRVWSSGPAPITACRSFPFSGNGFFFSIFSTATTVWRASSVNEEWEQDEEVVVVEEDDDDKGSSLEPRCSAGPEVLEGFSKRSNRHLQRASSLSFMATLKRPWRWKSSSSLDVISSFADPIVFSSSSVVYRRACFNSSMPCKSWKQNWLAKWMSKFFDIQKIR